MTTTNTDDRKLLKRYMRHVMAYNDDSFIYHVKPKQMSTRDRKVLREIEAEILAESSTSDEQHGILAADDDQDLSFSEQVANALKASKLSPAEIARMAGVPHSTISRFMNGHQDLSSSTIDKLRETGIIVEVVYRKPVGRQSDYASNFSIAQPSST